FKAVITPSESQAFLNQVLAVTIGALPTSSSFMGWHPPCDVVRFPARAIRPEILIRVLWAIRDGSEIELVYQSMRQPTASRRWVSPHAIAFDGTRWHVRAWCHQSSTFRDFVFSRIQQVYGERKSEVNAQAD